MTWAWLLKFVAGYIIGSILFTLLQIWLIKKLEK